MEAEAQAQPEKKSDRAKKPSPPRYKITNVVRRVRSRIRRAAAPGRARFKQYVCGRRLLRKQSIFVTEEEMSRYGKQIQEQVKAGVIEIETPDGEKICSDIHGNVMMRRGGKVEIAEKAESDLREDSVEEEVAEEEVAEEEVEEEIDEEVEDDLTELPGIGPGRARKLEAEGITSFAQLVEMGSGALAELLGVPEDTAADLCKAAEEMEG